MRVYAVAGLGGPRGRKIDRATNHQEKVKENAFSCFFFCSGWIRKSNDNTKLRGFFLMSVACVLQRSEIE